MEMSSSFKRSDRLLELCSRLQSEDGRSMQRLAREMDCWRQVKKKGRGIPGLVYVLFSSSYIHLHTCTTHGLLSELVLPRARLCQRVESLTMLY